MLNKSHKILKFSTWRNTFGKIQLKSEQGKEFGEFQTKNFSDGPRECLKMFFSGLFKRYVILDNQIRCNQKTKRINYHKHSKKSNREMHIRDKTIENVVIDQSILPGVMQSKSKYLNVHSPPTQKQRRYNIIKRRSQGAIINGIENVLLRSRFQLILICQLIACDVMIKFFFTFSENQINS